jgi:nucleotide-binding universal stress UspA family protein
MPVWIVLGWSGRLGFRARLFGSVTQSVLWSAHCLVAVARLLDSPLKIQRILVPVENLSTSALRPMRFAQILAQVNRAQVTLLHVCDPKTTPSRIAWTRSQLSLIVSQTSPDPSPTEIEIIPHDNVTQAILSHSVLRRILPNCQIIPHDNVTQAILRASQGQDLVVLGSLRRRIGADGLAVGETIAPLVQQLTCSVVMLGEPHGGLTNVLATSRSASSSLTNSTGLS